MHERMDLENLESQRKEIFVIVQDVSFDENVML